MDEVTSEFDTRRPVLLSRKVGGVGSELWLKEPEKRREGFVLAGVGSRSDEDEVAIWILT